MDELRVLLADDDRDFAESLEEILTSRGIYVECVYNGQAAIDRIMADNIDVLLLDLRMPVQTGLQVYEELQSKGVMIPAILITAYEGNEPDAIKRFNEISKGGIMSKPIDPYILIDGIFSLGHSVSGGDTKIPE